MVHKRSMEKLFRRQKAKEIRDLKHQQRRSLSGYIFENARQDFLQAETINMLTYQSQFEFLGRKYEWVLPEVVDTEKGEVIIDSRGNGSYQRRK